MRQFILAALLLVPAPALAQSPGNDQQPGQHFDIRAEDLPLPDEPIAYVDNAPVRVERGEHKPIVPDGFTVTLYAESLPNPRRIEVLPDESILVVQQRTGQIVRLGDTDDDGVADAGAIFASGFTQPFGIALVPDGPFKGDVLVTDLTGVSRIPLITGGNIMGVVAADSFGTPRGHITHALQVDPTTGDLFISVGSMANLAEEPTPHATVLRFREGALPRIWARGLRNATGLRLQPTTGDLYAVVMERDAMGDELVPDFFTRVAEGDDFGWPYQYAGGYAQPEFSAGGVKRVAADLPDVMFEAHSAPMDLIFLPDSWPEDYRGDAIVALKGSSNRTVPTGYKLVRIPFGVGHRPTGGYDNFATGFWVSGTGPAEVWGRPAALALLPDGGLLVADDFAGTLWKIMPPAP